MRLKRLIGLTLATIGLAITSVSLTSCNLDGMILGAINGAKESTETTTSQKTSTATSNVTSTPTSKATSAPTSQKTSTTTSKATSAPTSQKTSTATSKATSTPTSQKTSTATSKATSTTVKTSTPNINDDKITFAFGSRTLYSNGLKFNVKITNNTGATVYGLKNVRITLKVNGVVRADAYFSTFTTGTINNGSYVNTDCMFATSTLSTWSWWNSNTGSISISHSCSYDVTH